MEVFFSLLVSLVRDVFIVCLDDLADGGTQHISAFLENVKRTFTLAIVGGATNCNNNDTT